MLGLDLSPKALVIEDDENNLCLITTVLKMARFEVIEARTGQEGLDLAERLWPDVVITDISLPDFDGTEVLQQLKLNPRIKNIPVVAVTAFATTYDRDRLLAAGFSKFITKPIDVRSFANVVQSLLDS